MSASAYAGGIFRMILLLSGDREALAGRRGGLVGRSRLEYAYDITGYVTKEDGGDWALQSAKQTHVVA